MLRFEEITHHESVLAGTATPTLGPLATLGRLAELYLQTPESPGDVERAFVLTHAALDRVVRDNPLYPKLLHLHAMAIRWKQAAGKRAPGTIAEMDREAWKLSYDKAPMEAILFAMEWADWAWEREIWDEASEAYLMLIVRFDGSYCVKLSSPRTALTCSKIPGSSEGRIRFCQIGKCRGGYRLARACKRLAFQQRPATMGTSAAGTNQS